tara:strand:- start:2350 stop:3342 length:993 start_codon:yes stop_codon:yes gene_type:complete
MSRLVYMNGELVPESDAKVSIYDSSLMFGDMVFEMTRSFGGKQFKLEEHIDRLLTGVKIFRIPLEETKKSLIEKCNLTIEANKKEFSKDDEHRLMIDVSRGTLGIYQGVEGLHSGPNLIIADFPLKWTVRGMGKLFDEGINASVTSQRALPSSLLDPKIKNRSRVFYLMANIEASEIARENTWALLLDPDGYVAEGTGDNFFIVKDGKVISPEPRNILRGISRQYIMEELCPSLDLEVVEKNIDLYDVYDADEAFMTGTPFCMLPVVSINGLDIGSGKRGDIYSRLLTRWSKNEKIEIEDQIKGWDKHLDESKEGNKVSPYQFRSDKENK